MAETYGMCEECLEIDDISLIETDRGFVWLCSGCKMKLPKRQPSSGVFYFDRPEEESK